MRQNERIFGAILSFCGFHNQLENPKLATVFFSHDLSGAFPFTNSMNEKPSQLEVSELAQ